MPSGAWVLLRRCASARLERATGVWGRPGVSCAAAVQVSKHLATQRTRCGSAAHRGNRSWPCVHRGAADPPLPSHLPYAAHSGLGREKPTVYSPDRIRAELAEAVRGVEPGLAAADRLCRACVDLLDVDGAAISLVTAGVTHGTFGSSNALSRRLDEFQFTFGEGPCLDSVRDSAAVHVPDLRATGEARWPAYAGAVLGEGVHAVYALPVAVSTTTMVGVLDLFRNEPRELAGQDLHGGLLAAELAALPLLDLMTADVDWAAISGGDPWSQLASLERVEVYQATGMIIGRLGVGPAEALVRLRAHAFAHGLTASEVAWAIVRRELVLEADDSWRDPGHPGAAS